jgi:hypothetical protein
MADRPAVIITLLATVAVLGGLIHEYKAAA